MANWCFKIFWDLNINSLNLEGRRYNLLILVESRTRVAIVEEIINWARYSASSRADRSTYQLFYLILKIYYKIPTSNHFYTPQALIYIKTMSSSWNSLRFCSILRKIDLMKRLVCLFSWYDWNIRKNEEASTSIFSSHGHSQLFSLSQLQPRWVLDWKD